jgi:hypothetical protein
MKYLPTNVSSFTKMIRRDYTYVDKTQYIYNLFKKGASQYYFLSRPRRFGKTLLISTLRELFAGNRALFKGLWIDASDYEWAAYPIIHLDFSVIAHRSVSDLKESLTNHLDALALKHGFELDLRLPEDKFKRLIERLSEKNPVVVLIDEYDKPILDHLKNITNAGKQQDFLKSFYDVIKGMDDFLHIVFITGVSKFSKTSIFSGINNLDDISIKPEAAQLLGYTYDEIIHYFKNDISRFTQNKGIDESSFLEQLRVWYNGYRFSEVDVRVYNPFSVLYALKDQKFNNYWFESGTPSFLVHLLKNQYASLKEATEFEISPSSLETFDIGNIPLVPLLFQTGYLTFTDYDQKTNKFKLGYPNFEVEEAFGKFLVPMLSFDASAANPRYAFMAEDIQ